MNCTDTDAQQQLLDAQLLALAKNLQHPISTLKALNEALRIDEDADEEEKRKCLSENSRKIINLVADITANDAHAAPTTTPVIFTIFNGNAHVQSCCSKKPNLKIMAKTDLEWLKKLEDTVLRGISKRKIKLTDLAKELAVSERQLHRNVNRLTGLTPNNYIRILKLQQAKQYLENYAFRTIAEVSHAVGFSDTHYFSQIFLTQYGVLPRSLRPAS